MPHIKETLDNIVAQMSQVILGKELQIRLILTGLMARGHVLIEDMPGVGKTTLAHVLAHVLGLSFQRIQFTSDLLPADIIGVSVYDKPRHQGPIFAQMVLADEINRATPKTQSALLEAMAEHQVTVEGATRRLPAPFFVLATQNPLHQIGTFPLPESQLDRFMMRLELGYPNPQMERALLKGRDRREMIADLQPTLSIKDIVAIQNAVPQVHVAGPFSLQSAIAALYGRLIPPRWISHTPLRPSLCINARTRLHCAGRYTKVNCAIDSQQ